MSASIRNKKKYVGGMSPARVKLYFQKMQKQKREERGGGVQLFFQIEKTLKVSSI